MFLSVAWRFTPTTTAVNVAVFPALARFAVSAAAAVFAIALSLLGDGAQRMGGRDAAANTLLSCFIFIYYTPGTNTRMGQTHTTGGETQLALDPSPHVRECSCFCLGQFAEHCQPEILDHSEEVLPIVFRLLDDATDNVKVCILSILYKVYSVCAVCVFRKVCAFVNIYILRGPKAAIFSRGGEGAGARPGGEQRRGNCCPC